jgi:DNA-directed RNA polymerase specialized sigma24 family protein
MKIPKGMTEQQVIDQINIVIKRIAPRYTFYGYTVDDIRQESFIICMEALNRYDQKRPLENFLSVNLSNRLKNFVRDNHFTGDGNIDRQKLYQPAQLDYEDGIVDEENKYAISYDIIEEQQMVQIIDQHLPADMRMDYLKMMNDVYITKQRKDDILDVINVLLMQYGYIEKEEE